MWVIAVDGGAEKEKLCMSVEAEHFVGCTTVAHLLAEVLCMTTYGAHSVIDTAAAKGGKCDSAVVPALWGHCGFREHSQRSLLSWL